MRLSILSLGVSVIALPAALAQVPVPAQYSVPPVPYPLNVKPSSPQATLTGVPAKPQAGVRVEAPDGTRFQVFVPSVLPTLTASPPIMPPAQSHPTDPLTVTWTYTAPSASTKPKTRVFEVADLVHAPLQIPGAAALENIKATTAHTLMKLIVAMAKPDTWERHGGTGKIEFIAASDCLCVTNSPEAIAEVTKILEGLRRMQDQQVSLEVTLLTVPAGFGAKAGWPTFDDKGKVATKFCTPAELKKMLEVAHAEKRIHMMSNPKMTLTDGQAGFFQVGESVPLMQGTKSPEGILQTSVGSISVGTTLRCTPTVSTDGKCVGLKLYTSQNRLGSSASVAGAPSRVSVETLECQTDIVLPNGNSAIVHLGKQSVEERTEFKLPALSNVPYLNRLFRNVGIGTVEQDVYQIVTVRIFKETDFVAPVKPSAREVGTVPPAPCTKPVCGIELNHTAPKTVVVPKPIYSHGIGWFGGR